MIMNVGDRATYRGRPGWVLTRNLTHLGPEWWRIRRRVGRGFSTRVVQAGSLSAVVPLALDPGQEVRVGATGLRAVVVSFTPGERVTVEYPSEIRTTRGGGRWHRDAHTGQPTPDLINV